MKTEMVFVFTDRFRPLSSLIVRGPRLPCWSGKGDASRIEVLSEFLSTWLKYQALS
jgi:hypothetical protein